VKFVAVDFTGLTQAPVSHVKRMTFERRPRNNQMSHDSSTCAGVQSSGGDALSTQRDVTTASN